MVESSDSTEQFREINISGGSTNYFGELAFYLCMVLFLKNSIVVCVYTLDILSFYLWIFFQLYWGIFGIYRKFKVYSTMIWWYTNVL